MLAPPPVETNVTRSSRPNFLSAATESPPPTTETARLLRAIADGDLPRPGLERRHLEHAHRAVPEDGLGGGDRALEQLRRSSGRCRGPSCRRGSPRARRSRVSASSAIASATTKSTGSTQVARPCSAALASISLGRLDPVRLHERVADLDALGDEERERHAAADEQRVDAVDEAVDDAELVGDLAAAEDRDERALRVGEHRR